ncbi:MAG: hypothetical protein QGG50_02940 [Methanopyri archaeon]|jgi:hypothetical protein|nr:hypothetical protein [Methanopyri archaeon]
MDDNHERMLMRMAVVLLLILCPSFSITSADFDGASEIGLGSHTGSLGEGNELDTYTGLLESSSIVTVTFTSDAKYNQNLILYNPMREKVFTLYSKNGATVTETVYLANETETDQWFLGVESSNTGDYSFTISVTKQDDGATGTDVSAEYGEALGIATGTEIAGHLEGLDKADLYTLPLESGAIVTVTFTSQAEYSMNLKLYDPQRSRQITLYSKNGAIAEESLYLANETARDYWFVEIVSNEGDYTFTVSVADQDDGASGMDISPEYDGALPIETGEEIAGHLEGFDKKDMYTVPLGGPSTVSVTFISDAKYNQDLRLYDPQRQRQFTINSKNGAIMKDAVELTAEAEPGNWFVEIGGSNAGAYRFNVSVEAKESTGTTSPAPVPTAVPTAAPTVAPTAAPTAVPTAVSTATPEVTEPTSTPTAPPPLDSGQPSGPVGEGGSTGGGLIPVLVIVAIIGGFILLYMSRRGGTQVVVVQQQAPGTAGPGQAGYQGAQSEGNTQCGYCGASFVTKMARCPHCGANL